MSSPDTKRHEQERDVDGTRSSTRPFWTKIGSIGGAAIVIVVGLILLDSGPLGTRDAHPYDSFAQCLTDNGLIMYGTDWCPYCQKQKKMFEEAFDYIDYVNCDFNTQQCRQKNVDRYPTWHLNDKLLEIGVLNFHKFSNVTGCELPDIVE